MLKQIFVTFLVTSCSLVECISVTAIHIFCRIVYARAISDSDIVACITVLFLWGNEALTETKTKTAIQSIQMSVSWGSLWIRDIVTVIATTTTATTAATATTTIEFYTSLN